MQEDKKWIIQDIDKEALFDLQQKTDLSETLLKVLLARGFKELQSIKDFLFPKKEDLFNPFMLEGMHKSVLRIKQAIEDREKVLIYADRDVDGITSLAILYNTIFVLGGNVVWYIPSDEGYGLSCNVLDKYKNENVSLVITVDCGISAVKEVEYAKGLSMDVVITDHHEPPQDGLPNAYSVIDPKISSCTYPFKELAGCGVSFKLSQALMLSYGKFFDKKIAVIAIDKNKCYGLMLVNDIVLNEFEKNIDETELCDCAKIITDDLQSLNALKNIGNISEIQKIELENKSDYKSESEEQTIRQKAYKLLELYRKKEFFDDGRMLEFFENNVDLVALGSIADIVPLIKENRTLVKSGLEILNDNCSKRFGLGYIFEEYLKNKNICSKAISWNVAPILNAAGRMGNAAIAAQLLLADDKYMANDFFVKLKKLNNDRKELQNENIKHFDILLKQQCDIEKDNIFVVSAKDLSHGVTGIVASQMVKTYGKPVILFIEDKEKSEATGACRSIDGFDMIYALDKTKDLLIKFGGHNQAAGLTIKTDKIDEFRNKIKLIAQETISKDMVSKKIVVDCEIKISDINKKTYKDLMLLEPFGASNANPVFLLKNVSFKEITVIGSKHDHLKFKVCKDGISINALFWNAAKYKDTLGYKDRFNVLFNMDMNRDNIQLIILDIENI